MKACRCTACPEHPPTTETDILVVACFEKNYTVEAGVQRDSADQKLRLCLHVIMYLAILQISLAVLYALYNAQVFL
jgi:hypothetical protein